MLRLAWAMINILSEKPTKQIKVFNVSCIMCHLGLVG